MDKVVALCKNRGFVYPGSEIYGGLANSWDYGPLGAELKKNIKDRVVRSSQPGSIVLFHANVNGVKYYLDDILTKLEEENYEMVPVSELIYQDNYTVDSNGVQKIKK